MVISLSSENFNHDIKCDEWKSFTIEVILLWQVIIIEIYYTRIGSQDGTHSMVILKMLL